MFYRYLQAGLISLGLAVGAVGASQAATFTIDFEDRAWTGSTGALLGISGTLIPGGGSTGLDYSLSRGGVTFDIQNILAFGGPSEFGKRSLSPFAEERNSTPFIMSFSRAVQSVSLLAGDFGQDTPDFLRLIAFGGSNGTGPTIDRDDGSLITTDPQNNPFKFTSLSVSGGGIQSVSFLGGSRIFPHSVYYDRIQVTLADGPTDGGVSVVPLPATASSLLVSLGLLAGIPAVRRRRTRWATKA